MLNSDYNLLRLVKIVAGRKTMNRKLGLVATRMNVMLEIRGKLSLQGSFSNIQPMSKNPRNAKIYEL